MKKIYKIYHPYMHDKDNVYIETEMSFVQVADIVTGLEFYIEDKTKYGMHTSITEDMAAYFLCEFCECEIYDEKNLHLLSCYDEDAHDLDEEEWIDLCDEREVRCGKRYRRYEKLIKKHKSTEYLKKLCCYYNDGTVFGTFEDIRFLSPEEVMARY